MDLDLIKLGVRVRQQRALCELTQQELARKVGVTTSFIGHIERGEKKASIETLVALCNAMTISPTVLLQDSLTDDVLQSQQAFEQDDMELMKGMMSLLRERERKKDRRK